MFFQSNIDTGRILAAGIVVSIALSPSGMCQDLPDQEAQPESPEIIEEIVVRGHKPLLQLRVELYRAEDAFYELFNTLNSDDEFDVHCRREARVGSHIQRRVCKPNFERRLTAEATREWLLGGQLYQLPVPEIERKTRLMLEKMEALVAERPEMLEALNELSDAKRAMDSERRRRCEDRKFTC